MKYTKILKAFYKIYWRVEGVIAPTLKYSQYLYEDILKFYVNPNVKWLDLGCGHQILPTWRSEEEKHLVGNCKVVVGIDYDLHSLKNHKNICLKVKGDITKLPFRDSFFDLVTANMVVEHLDNPDVQFKEIIRILKPGGIFIFHTPNALGYTTIMTRLVPNILKDKLTYLFQGRKEEDIFITYYRANTRKRINNLAKTTRFEVVKIKMIVSSAQFIIIPPLVILEIIWIRILMMKLFKPLRTNIIAILKKQ
jgi:ubiquinone/menaquinone biosynthesis C-methylase UbiE